MARGVRPERIAFVSFTKKAADEAAQRARDKFGFEKEQLPYFRTLHSIAYRELGIEKKQVMANAHYKELGSLLGIKFTGGYAEDEGIPIGGTDGDRMLFMDHLARSRCVELRDQFELMNDFTHPHWLLQKQFSDTLRVYKQDCNLVDFTDMLFNYCASGMELDVDVAFVDEAQDLSLLQWAMVHALFPSVKALYIAGDDDQAIFRWSGADVEAFMSLEGPQEVLSKSYRLPEKVHAFASAIINRVHNRFDKPFSSRGVRGDVVLHNSLSSIDLRDGKTWMLLCRNAYMQKQFVELATRQGVAYSTKGGSSVKASHLNAIRTWERLVKGEMVKAEHAKSMYDQMRVGLNLARGAKAKLDRENGNTMLDMQKLRHDFGLAAHGSWYDSLDGISEIDRLYYRDILRNGEKLHEEPRVMINTIHGVKGGEADNVVLMTDMAKRTYEEYLGNNDDEHRVFYVGATRAKETLHIITPQTWRHYPLH